MNKAQYNVSCSFCDEAHPDHDDMNGIQSYENGKCLVWETGEWNDYYDSYNTIQVFVNYCPMCGKKLMIENLNQNYTTINNE